jgi:hypothetical protein
MKIKLNDIEYEVITDYKDAFNKEDLEKLYTDYFKNYDYILGDYAYNKLRLKGFCDKKNELCNDINDYEKDLDNNKDKEKNNYEKYILKSEAFERMRKSLPLVTGFSKILNSKIKKSEINNKKINQKNINENIKLKYSINDKNKMNNKKKNKGFIYNF